MIKFTSGRKRSSIVVQFVDKGSGGAAEPHLMLLCKGADTVITPRLDHKAWDSPETKKTLDAMASFAEDGLRTLCIAGRELSVEEYEPWAKRFEEATQAMVNRQARVEEVAEEIESGLTLQGVTGIEDRLQDGVPDTIVTMQRAGIKVWMLTGDKTETAVNIGIATGLLEPAATQGDLERPIFDWDGIEVP